MIHNNGKVYASNEKCLISIDNSVYEITEKECNELCPKKSEKELQSILKNIVENKEPIMKIFEMFKTVK